MNTATIAGIILASCGALILGMAALIKTMVVGKLDSLQASMDEMWGKHHALDVRVTRLEAQHETIFCRRSTDEN
jgi:hypothetical protein